MQNAAPQGPEELLAEGLAQQKAGRQAIAGLYYASLLQHHPAYPAALHADGLAAFQAGRFEDAILAIGGLVALQPRVSVLHRDLGIICAAAQKLDWAERCLAQAAALEPAEAAIWAELGAVRLRLGKAAEAQQGLRTALRLAPGGAEWRALLGVALLRAGQPVEARQELQSALGIPTQHAAAHNAIGMLAAELGNPVVAEAHYRTALRLDAADEVVWSNLAKLLRDVGRFEEAIAAAREATRLGPQLADGHCVLGHALTAAGQLAEADESYAAALALQPDHAEARYHRGLSCLLAGRFHEGWEGYAWRWRRRGYAPPHAFSRPDWDGTPRGGATLLLHAEQGSGDTIMMARYVSQIAAQSPVVLLVQPGLERLMARLPGVAACATSGAELPRFDLQRSLMDLPLLLGTTPATIPAGVPYLSPDPADRGKWRARLAGRPGKRVGLAWAGNPEHRSDHRRSLPVALLAELTDLPGVTWVSLQKSGVSLQNTSPAPHPMLDWTGELADFADTAALVAELDLVIAVDTAVAHLAGALGRPVWLLNRFDPCWRWLLHRADSPWYPTLRQFRQTAPGDWGSVLSAARTALMQAVQEAG